MVVNIHDSSIVFDGAFEDLDVVLPMGDWMYCTKGETNVETVNIVTGEVRLLSVCSCDTCLFEMFDDCVRCPSRLPF